MKEKTSSQQFFNSKAEALSVLAVSITLIFIISPGFSFIGDYTSFHISDQPIATNISEGYDWNSCKTVDSREDLGEGYEVVGDSWSLYSDHPCPKAGQLFTYFEGVINTTDSGGIENLALEGREKVVNAELRAASKTREKIEEERSTRIIAYDVKKGECDSYITEYDIPEDSVKIDSCEEGNRLREMSTEIKLMKNQTESEDAKDLLNEALIEIESGKKVTSSEKAQQAAQKANIKSSYRILEFEDSSKKINDILQQFKSIGIFLVLILSLIPLFLGYRKWKRIKLVNDINELSEALLETKNPDKELIKLVKKAEQSLMEENYNKASDIMKDIERRVK